MTVHRSKRAFSLIELAMVVATMGAVAAIAAPRLSSAATNASSAAVTANLRILQNAVDTYAAEHNETSLALDSKGNSVPLEVFVRRLIDRTDEQGNPGVGIYGPYLRTLPRNPGNYLKTVRVDGVAAGSGAAGWRFDSETNSFMPDDPYHATAIAAGRVGGGDK